MTCEDSRVMQDLEGSGLVGTVLGDDGDTYPLDELIVKVDVATAGRHRTFVGRRPKAGPSPVAGAVRGAALAS